MKFKEIPNTDRPEWLQWRHKGIGSSDASVIMGVSRFKEYPKLVLEKALPFSGEDQANAYIKDRGNKIEKQVRSFLESQENKTFAPVSFEMANFTFLRATVDGITEDRKIITEIKLLSSVNPAKINKSAEGYVKWEAARRGIVPKEYYPQIQHQLMVTGAEKCIFMGYKEVRGDYVVTADKLATIDVLPDKDYIEKLALNEFKFWLDVEKRRDMLNYKGELE